MKLRSGRHGRAAVVLTTAVFSIVPSGFAQTAAPSAAPPTAGAASGAAPARPTTLAPVLVTGNPLGSREVSAPATVLAGDELTLRRGSSLGETLSGQPGVSATYFGPNANRPIIRGFDGDRIRMLSNSGASFDASSLSFDHAVPIDPLVVERIEVLRGPSALLYGGNAIGGVVNAIDNRIPKYAVSGVSGAGEARLGGAARERAGAALIEAGNEAFALHGDVFGRKTSDLEVPRHAPVDAEGNVLERTDRVRNSAARTDGGSIGGSWLFGSGYLGISADTYDSRYGIVAEEDVIIRMKRDHVALAGELRDLGGPLRSIRFQANDTRYRHEEVEGGGEIGTTFRTRGPEARVEVEHAPIGPMKGIVGAQFENFDFSALGEEAFVPTTHTRRNALFVVEEAETGLGTFSGGVRFERAEVSSDGDEDGTEPRFGPPVERTFTPTSVSLGWLYKVTGEWSVSANLASTERAPTSFELYANGIHAATGAFERGDSTLGVERGRNVDLAVQWKRGDSSARLGVFAADFSRYISLEATGESVQDEEESFPVFEYRPVRARFYGFEAEARHRLRGDGFSLDLLGKVDYTRATHRDTGEPLPRIAPLRATLGTELRSGPWLGRIEVELAARQNRVPETDSETAGYGIVNAAVSYQTAVLGQDALLFVKASNIGDKLAYNAATVQTIRGLVPLPGRALSAGLRVSF